MPDIVSLIIWLVAGVSGGFAASDILNLLRPTRSAFTGAVGGVVGTKILQLLIPALNGFDTIPIVGQLIASLPPVALL